MVVVVVVVVWGGFELLGMGIFTDGLAYYGKIFLYFLLPRKTSLKNKLSFRGLILKLSLHFLQDATKKTIIL